VSGRWSLVVGLLEKTIITAPSNKMHTYVKKSPVLWEFDFIKMNIVSWCCNKAMIAFENRRVPRTHDLLACYLEVEKTFPLNDEELDILTRASGYFSEERYPNPNYTLPSRVEIETVLSFSFDFFDRVLQTLAIEKHEL
jgi:hypothetical protein